MGRFQRVAASVVLAILLAGVVGACSASGDDLGASSGGDSGGSVEGNAVAESAQRDSFQDYGAPATAGRVLSADATGLGGTLDGAPEVGPSVIKTASIEVEVDKDGLNEATRAAISIAGRSGGFVLSTETHDESHGAATVVVRIPADAFERALADLEDLGEVKTERISGEDVSQQFVDLEARLRNLEAQEGVLLRLMDRSVSVADTIRVQRELQGVQLEIERLTGRVRYLKDQADLGTISVSFVEVGAPAHKPPSGVLAKAWSRAVDVALSVVAAVIVGTGALIPVALLAAVAFLVLRALKPRFSSPS